MSTLTIVTLGRTLVSLDGVAEEHSCSSLSSEPWVSAACWARCPPGLMVSADSQEVG